MCTASLHVVGICILGFALPIFAQNSESRTQMPVSADYSFTVAAHKVWIDTGLDLKPGDRIHVYGGVIACGGPSPREKQHLPLPSAPGGALIAKLHAEAEPILATPDADLPILTPSHLYLGVNGWQCSGSIPAKVHVEGRGRRHHTH